MKFSIIIPVYNVAPYLRKCLDSVLAQTETEWECICVDDGATDSSPVILDEYAERDSRFVIVHKSNEGVSVARNIGLDKAIGEWITFVDADDWLETDYLAEMFSSAESSGLGISMTSVRKVFDNGRFENVGPSIDGEYSPEDLYLRYNSWCAWSFGKLIRRKEFANIRYPGGIVYSEDRCIMHRLLYPHARISVVGRPLYNYRIRRGSAIMSDWTMARLQVGQALMLQISYFKEFGFRRAEVFTAGLYLKWMPPFVNYLRGRSADDDAILDEEVGRIRSVFKEYFYAIVKISRKEGISELQPSIRLLENYYSVNGVQIGWFACLFNVFRYDGIKAFLLRIAHRIMATRCYCLIKLCLQYSLYFGSYLTPRFNGKIVVGGWFGSLYGDNPRYFVDYVLANTNLKVIWVGEEKIRNDVPKYARLEFVPKGSLKAIYHLLTTRRIVCCHMTAWDFSELPIFPRSTSRVKIVNTWHGIPIKKMGASLPGSKDSESTGWKARVKHFFWWRNEYVCVSSDEMGGILGTGWVRAFSPERVLRIGTPRNDFLLAKSRDMDYIRCLKEKYAAILGFDKSRKVVMYMPTWRSGKGTVRTFYGLDADSRVKLKKVLDDNNAVMIEKHHYMTYVNNLPEIGSTGNMIAILPELVNKIDTQELLLISDVMISDYSGAYIDYGLLRRPVIHYAYDYEFYKNVDTGLSYELSDVAAGPIVNDFSGLLCELDISLSRPSFSPANEYYRLVKYETGRSSDSILKFFGE